MLWFCDFFFPYVEAKQKNSPCKLAHQSPPSEDLLWKGHTWSVKWDMSIRRGLLGILLTWKYTAGTTVHKENQLLRKEEEPHFLCQCCPTVSSLKCSYWKSNCKFSTVITSRSQPVVSAATMFNEKIWSLFSINVRIKMPWRKVTCTVIQLNSHWQLS